MNSVGWGILTWLVDFGKSGRPICYRNIRLGVTVLFSLRDVSPKTTTYLHHVPLQSLFHTLSYEMYYS